MFIRCISLAPVNKSIPPLFLSEIDPSTFPLEFNKESTDWFAVFNPRTDRVLDIDLVQTLGNYPSVSLIRQNYSTNIPFYCLVLLVVSDFQPMANT